ncbi:hypothetical protein [Glaciihabitans tibetensis]|uniref:hypothetical protein n=1 Tax=Glaciihabitans tibetensis TaxID=1266600 RepID=UPI000D05E69E|nr:hypothetical protein [Glaciihabitans tibetensis]
MTSQLSQPAVLPRHVAAAATVAACVRCVWAIAATIIVMAIASVITTLASSGDLPSLGAPLAALVVMLVALGVVALRPSALSLAGFIVVGAVCVWAYQYSLMVIAPELNPGSVFVLNRPALALVLVGTASASPINAIGWGVAGYLAGQASVILVAFQFDVPPSTGAGPTLVLVNYVGVFLAIALIQRAQNGRVPDLRRLRQETELSDKQRDRERADAALLHDTILSDLSLIINSPPLIDDRVRARLLHDITTLAHPEWRDDARRSAHPRDTEFRNAVTNLASEFHGRGLSVDVTIDPGAVADVPPTVVEAALGAARACLENVLNHSGEDSAELIIGIGAGPSGPSGPSGPAGVEGPSGLAADPGSVEKPGEVLTLMVVDAGVGFDPAAVPADRLGLRASVVHRVESLGGTVRVWSAPGSGASVLLSFPIPVRGEREPVDA